MQQCADTHFLKDLFLKIYFFDIFSHVYLTE